MGQGYAWDSSCKGDCPYNTLWATKGAFLHRKYYESFWNAEYSKLREAVNAAVTGEDLLMSAVLMIEHVTVEAVHAMAEVHEVTDVIPQSSKPQSGSLQHRTSKHRPRIRDLIAEHVHTLHPGLPNKVKTKWMLVDPHVGVHVEDKPCRHRTISCSHTRR